MKKIFMFFCLTFIFFFIPIDAYAEDYIITKYDMDIIVNENNTMDITENIDTYFYVYKHGIYRKIPLKNKIERLDGSMYSNRAIISDISVSDPYTASTEGQNKVIKIGDPNSTIIGEKSYTIKYNYNIGKDSSKKYDEFYFNIIGPEWDTTISNVSFAITMPNEFDATKIGFSSGVVGSTSNNVTYDVNGNVITGVYNGILNPGEALTIRIELPEGYFVGASMPMDQTRLLMLFVPLGCLLVTFLIWLKFGKDNQVIETVEFYPPGGFNSLDLAFLYKGKADSEDVTSLLIYLANCGYLKIVETDEKILFSRHNSFKIVKLREYDGSDENEREFFYGLFKKRKRYKNPEREEVVEVTLRDLENSFYKVVAKILKNVNKKENKYKIFESNAKWKSFVVIIMILLSFVTLVGIPSYDYGSTEEIIMTVAIACFYVPFYFAGLFGDMPWPIRIFVLGFTIFHSSIFFMALPIGAALRNDLYYLLLFVIGLVCVGFMIFLYKHLPKRTKYGNEILGKILGFKRFLECAEKEKLEAMVVSNPTYFYDILPYTYVLDISDKWISKFEVINISSPDWYSGSSSFNVRSFGSFMNVAVRTANASMNSSPSSSSGGSSGGGSSGGGSGGGGGGSW